jgi:predicted nucleotidyltransferase
MEDKFGVSDIHWQEIIREIGQNLGTTSNPTLYIFGSRAKKSNRKYSDIDVMLCADSFDKPSLKNIDFENTNIPYIVDLILRPDLFEKYVEEVDNHKILITDFK